jgi:peroxiredoxin
MTLSAELNTLLTQHLPGKLSAEQLTVLKEHLGRLATENIEAKSLKVGDTVPDITLPNASEKPVSVQTILKQGPVVLTFYRGSWCPFCNLQLNALQQELPKIKQAGASLIAISPQTPDNSLDVVEKHNLTFEVLSDAGNRIAKQFGLVFKTEDAFKAFQSKLGVDLAEFNNDATYELPTPATYIINTDGKIAYASVQSDWTQRIEPSEVVEALKRLPALR